MLPFTSRSSITHLAPVAHQFPAFIQVAGGAEAFVVPGLLMKSIALSKRDQRQEKAKWKEKTEASWDHFTPQLGHSLHFLLCLL